jgi:hypothetical protein
LTAAVADASLTAGGKVASPVVVVVEGTPCAPNAGIPICIGVKGKEEVVVVVNMEVKLF